MARARLYSIGEVAARTDVSVQTLRHYHKLGLLEPSTVSEAGYRRYSEHDRARLKLIRTLRNVGFDLKTIRELLEGLVDTREVLRLQVAVLNEEIGALKRQQVVLNAVTRSESKETELLSKLQRLDVLARLDRLERETFLAEQLSGARAPTPESEAIWRAAVLALPETMTEAQLEAWLELAELTADESFQAVLARQGKPFRALDAEAKASWHRLLAQVDARARKAYQQELDPTDESAQQLVNEWVGGLAEALGRKPDRAFLVWMVEHFSSTNDPRFQRYWQLVADLKDLPFASEHAQAFEWLLEALREKVQTALD